MMSSAVQLPPTQLTVDEFFEWSSGTTGRWFLRDGEPVAMNPPALVHAAMHSALNTLLANHLRAVGDRCQVLTGAGIVPHANSDHNFLIPDLTVACMGLAGPERAVAEPLILIELLSPSNARNTRANVFAYTTIPTVQ